MVSPQVSFPNSPHSESITSSLLQGNGSAEEYVQQLSGGSSTLQVTVTDDVWVSEFAESYWGADSQDERDIGNNGMGVDKLVENAAKNLLSGLDLSDWDNGDWYLRQAPYLTFRKRSGIWRACRPQFGVISLHSQHRLKLASGKLSITLFPLLNRVWGPLSMK